MNNKSNLKGRWRRKPSQVPQSSQTSVSSNAMTEQETEEPSQQAPEFVPTYSTNNDFSKSSNHELLNPGYRPASADAQTEGKPAFQHDRRQGQQRGGERSRPFPGRRDSRNGDDRGRFQREDGRRDVGRRREFSPSRNESSAEKAPMSPTGETPKCFCSKIYSFFRNLFVCKDKQCCPTACNTDVKDGRGYSRQGRSSCSSSYKPRWKR